MPFAVLFNGVLQKAPKELPILPGTLTDLRVWCEFGLEFIILGGMIALSQAVFKALKLWSLTLALDMDVSFYVKSFFCKLFLHFFQREWL